MKNIVTILTALLITQYVVANDKCKVIIDSTDTMSYNTKTFDISKSCQQIELTLNHVGKIPKSAMGHNIVITTTSDFQAVAVAGMSAGIENNYVTPDDKRVIANTIVIGGGESTTIKVDTSVFEKGSDYTFFCSFPGHYAMMKGKVIIVD